MIWFRNFCLIALLILATFGCKQTRDQQFGSLSTNQEQSSILVKFKPKVKSSSTKKEILKEEGLESAKKLRRLDIFEVKTAPGQAKKKVAELEKNPLVEYAEPNFKRKAFLTPNDTYYSLQYGLTKIEGPAAWDTERGQTSSVTIAVVDTGVQLNHPDLASKIVAGFDFVNGDASANDDHGHGTHVAGIASALTNNSLGVAGVSWGANIMPVKVLDSFGSGTDANVSDGITWAADNGAKVINLSLGGYDFSQTLQNATDYAYNRGVTVLAAAGNDGSNITIYPAGNTNVAGVGATNSSDGWASFSNYNSSVDVSAPGVSILSTYIDSSLAYLSGTSMATPCASGVVALIRSKNPSMSVDSVFSTLTLSSTDLGSAGRDNFFGWGRVDAYNAVSGNPVISNLSIAEGSYLRDGKLFSASVRDSDGISSVEFYIDSALKVTDTSEPYQMAISTKSLTNGVHTFGVKAIDASNNSSSANRTARIDNYKPKTFAPKKTRAIRKGARKIARARFYWKAYDPFTGNKAKVKLKIFKRRVVNGKVTYRYVKGVNYGLTTINKLRYFSWRTRNHGIFKFYVMATDRAGNPQRYRARNYVIVK